jgi:hypothetical protein
MNTPNRIVLVHNHRRIFEQTGISVELLEQDDGKTLKVFVTDLPPKKKMRDVERHRNSFARSLRDPHGDQPST